MAITCPNNCDYDLLERDDFGVDGMSEHPPHAEYYCDGCGWTAIWRRGVPGLDIIYTPFDSLELDEEYIWNE